MRRLLEALIVLFGAIATSTLAGDVPQSRESYGTRLSQRAASALDAFTVKTLTSVSTSVHVQLEKNQTLHCLSFRGSGNGPPIVLLHGISSCAADYYPLIRCLQQYSRRIVAIDLPGHGQSVADPSMTVEQLDGFMITSLTEACKTLGLNDDKFVLLGNSLGGFVACKYASLHSSKLHSLILLSPAGAPLSEDELAQLKRLFSINTLGDAVKFLDSVLGNTNRLPWGLRQLVGWACRERTRRPAVQRILQEATLSNRLLESDVAIIRCPILLVWGQREAVFGAKQLDWFLGHLPSQFLSVVRPREVGHVPHLDAAAVSESIVRFLESL